MSGRLSLEPGPVWRFWWISTEPARLSDPAGVRAVHPPQPLALARPFNHPPRSVTGLVGHAWWTLGLLLSAVSPVPVRLMLVGLVLIEVAQSSATKSSRGSAAHGRRCGGLGWKFHRQWPRAWADTAAKTREVQSFDGSSRGESRAAAVRPVVDHPRMPWRFWLRWPVVTFRIGVAPGRTFAQFERVINAMAANMPWVHAIELEYRTDRSSFGLLHVALADVLDREPDRPPGPVATVTCE